MSVAVIEYQFTGYTPPSDSQAWDIEAQITHAERVAISGKALLSELRQALEEAGLRKAGACITNRRSGSTSRWLPKWREVWRHKDIVSLNHQQPLSPRAQKARQESAARTRLYQSRKGEDMGKYDERLRELASKAQAKHPELKDRPRLAAELVRRGHVEHQGGSRFTVKSQGDDGKKYHVDTEARTCTCADHRGLYKHKAPTINGAPLCKHRIACLMLAKLQEVEAAPDPARIHREEKRIAALQAGAILI
jgi:hypothetical protein